MKVPISTLCKFVLAMGARSDDNIRQTRMETGFAEIFRLPVVGILTFSAARPEPDDRGQNKKGNGSRTSFSL
jgi:hypothetical protein